MATAATSSLPLALSLAIARIDQILRSSQLLYAGGRFKEMRGDRLEAIGVLLVTMLRHCCIQNDGHIVLLINNGKEAVPITIKQLASLSGLGVKRVVRCLHELREAGFLSSRPQFRRNSKGSSTLLVAACFRSFTRQFWSMMGLWGVYVSCVRYAQKQPVIRLRARVYQIARDAVARPLALIRAAVGAGRASLEAKDKKLRDAAFMCLMVTHGGEACRCPDCSPAQRAVCQQLRQ